MKKIILAILVFMFTLTPGFAAPSPTLKGEIYTKPTIPFEFASEIELNTVDGLIFDLFGKRIARQFHICEALEFDVQEDWGIVEFKFMQEFTDEDTVLAIFQPISEEGESFILFLEYEDGWFPIDFTIIPLGVNRMYIVSDYE